MIGACVSVTLLFPLSASLSSSLPVRKGGVLVLSHRVFSPELVLLLFVYTNPPFIVVAAIGPAYFLIFSNPRHFSSD